ncbi:hypothetical protein PG988_012921 [Apiospora saccharicola]
MPRVRPTPWGMDGHESRMTGSWRSANSAEWTGDDETESSVLKLRIDAGTESLRACQGRLVTSRGMTNAASSSSSSAGVGVTIWSRDGGIVMLIRGDVVVVKQVFVAVHGIRLYRQGRAGSLPGWGLDNQVVIVFRGRLLLSRCCGRFVGGGIYAAAPFLRWMRRRLPVLLHSVIMAGVWL